MKFGLAVLSVLLLAFAPSNSRVELEYFRGREVNGVPMLEWVSRSEPELAHYDVMCSTPYTDGFQSVGEVMPQGVGKRYEFVHQGLYKSTTSEAQYKLVAVSTSGARQDVSLAASVSYTSTAVKKTWGSIKAMFQ